MADLLPSLQEAAGEALRAVAEYDREGVEIVYERDDVSQKGLVIEDIHEELIINDLGRERLEDLFKVGEWHCTIHKFEEAICIHYSRGDWEGTFVSVDTGADAPIERLAEICQEQFN
jgi:hypothetical protein